MVNLNENGSQQEGADANGNVPDDGVADGGGASSNNNNAAAANGNAATGGETGGNGGGGGGSEVYVIPDYQTLPGRPQILVLPYVPFPNSTNNNSNNNHQQQQQQQPLYLGPPPPQYFNSSSSTVPTSASSAASAYPHDPPPEYNSWSNGNGGGNVLYCSNGIYSNPSSLLQGGTSSSSSLRRPVRSPSGGGNSSNAGGVGVGSHCSCCTQETHLPNSYVSDSIYETILYPNLFNETHGGSFHHSGGGGGRYNAQHPCHRARYQLPGSADTDDDDSDVDTVYEVIRDRNGNHARGAGAGVGAVSSAVSSSQEESTLAVRRWVFIVLVIGLLVTASLLLGVTLQHFQLLSRVAKEGRRSAANQTFLEDGADRNYTDLFAGQQPNYSRLPKHNPLRRMPLG